MHTHIIRLLTFPGIIFHAMIRQIFCRWAGLVVLDVCYFSIAMVPVRLEHEEPLSWRHTLFVTCGPFLLSSFIALLAGLSAVEALRYSGPPWLTLPLTWLAFSIAANSFPTPQDAELVRRRGEASGPIVKFLSLSLGTLMTVAFYGSFVFFEIIYAVIVVICLPMWLVESLAGAY